MNAVNGGSIQRSDSTHRTLAASSAASSTRIARNNRPRNDLFCATPTSFSQTPHALHDDRLDGHVVEAALAAGFDRGDLVDDVHAFGHLGEHGVAEVAARVDRKSVV